MSYAQPSANSKRKGRKDKKPALLFRVDSACTFCLLMTRVKSITFVIIKG